MCKMTLRKARERRVAQEGEFVKTTPLLYPGFRSTPEFGAALKAPITSLERRRLIEEARRQSRAHLEQTGDFSLVKWFHERGVPQIIQTDKQIYRY